MDLPVNLVHVRRGLSSPALDFLFVLRGDGTARNFANYFGNEKCLWIPEPFPNERERPFRRSNYLKVCDGGVVRIDTPSMKAA